MGSFSTCRALAHWQGLLLAVSLLNFQCLPTTAQFAIVSTDVAEWEDVRLHLRNVPPDVKSFHWYRGEGAKPHRKITTLHEPIRAAGREPMHSRQEIQSFDGSLLLRKVMKRDAGMYTVVAHLQNSLKEIGFGRLNVYEPVIMVNLVASNTTVTENKDAVVLTCYSKATSTQWFFYGWYLQLTERMKLSHDRKSLTIYPVKREDAGFYQCEGSNPISSVRSWPLGLDVRPE